MRMDVSRWLSRRTYTATDYQAAALAAAKRAQGRTVSVVLPALNEERTVGVIVAAIRCELVERHALVDELVVVDSGSTDQTAATAASAGARVVRSVVWDHSEVAPGEVLIDAIRAETVTVLIRDGSAPTGVPDIGPRPRHAAPS